MKTRLDDDLRERWVDPVAGARELDAARAELQARRAADDGSHDARAHVGRALQRLSEACRFSGELDEAVQLKVEALQIWNTQGKRRAAFLVRLQRALVLAELGDDAAGVQMDALFEELRGDQDLEPYYLDFLLEYDARRLYYAGDLAGAAARLTEAHSFRVANRAARIVEWTASALERVRRRAESV